MNLKNVAHDESLNVKFLRSTIESTYLPTRDEVDAVLSKPIIPGEVERDFELPAFIGADMWKRACQKFAALVRKNRLKLLFELEGDKMDLLLAETQNLLKPDTSLSAFAALRDIFYEPFTGWGINGCGGHELENAHQLLHRLRHKMVIRYSKNPNILGSDELRWFARYDPIGMLLVTKEDIGSVIGGFSIDETTGKFLVATIPAEIQDDTDALKDLVRTYYEVYREEKKQNEIRELAGSIV
jgi:hypothetical protein